MIASLDKMVMESPPLKWGNDQMAEETTQKGENGHIEYGWSTNLQEKILQFSFQLTRTHDNSQLLLLSEQLHQMLLVFFWNRETLTEKNTQDMFIALYKMIGHTRDIVDGKGERSLSYMQIMTWYKTFPELAKYALSKFVTFESEQHPYGSWKDMKLFCNYCKTFEEGEQHPLIDYCITLLNTQIRQDYNGYITNSSTSTSTSTTETTSTTEQPKYNISLAAKWVPNETSQSFSWLYERLAYHFYSHFFVHAKEPFQLKRAQNKAKMSYRQMCSTLNKELDTVQIKQCAGTWATIDHNRTTSITHSKCKKAFLNVTKKGETRSELQDRIQCAENYKHYVETTIASGKEIKGKRVGMNDFTKQARELLQQPSNSTLKTEIDILNSQWIDNGTQTGVLQDMIAMVDFSGSMAGDPLDCAMALGCRIAEKSLLGKRLLSFSNNPTWHNLDKCKTFVEMIHTLQKGEVGFSTNFYRAFQVILDAIVQANLQPDQVSKMVLAILSDMQINDAEQDSRYESKKETLFQRITQLYAETGIRLHGIPFKPPHILFWNLRSTSGFPGLSTDSNVTMVSGFSPALLKMFCEKGLDAFETCTPWSQLLQSMSSERYSCLEQQAHTIFPSLSI